MSAARTDVIVIGGGVCGLATAGLLARRGRTVTLLERATTVGGIAARREFEAGFAVPGILHDTSRVDDALIDALGLKEHGLQRCPRPSVLLSDGHERTLELTVDLEQTRAWRAWIEKVAPVVKRVLEEPPLPLDDPLRKLAWPTLKLGRQLRRLGRRDMMEFLRVPPMCLADWLQEWFDDELLAAGLAFPALEGVWAGPWSAGTAANLLFREASRGASVVGGPAAFAQALLDAANASGVTIRTDAEVREIRTEAGAAKGVTLTDGEQIDGTTVVSALDPKTTLLDLVAPTALDPAVADDFVNWRCRGALAKVHLGIRGDAPFEKHGRVRVARSLDDVERSYDALKYGTVPERPTLDAIVPSLDDPGLAPEGHHVVSVIFGFAPDAETAKDTPESLRDAVLRRTVETLCSIAPGLDDRVVAHEVLLPVDLESEFGLAGGHLFHGELALDQIVMRPSLACRGHGSPISGLYLCGPGTHPGTAPTGASARLAAAAIARG